MNKDAFATRRRGHEEPHFQRLERELVEKLRRRAEEDRHLRRLAEYTGIADQDILNDLRTLGYTPETLMLLHLAPLVQVAWADGDVSERERELIIETARLRGIDQDSAAGRQLEEWLTWRPSNEAFDTALRVIVVMLQGHPTAERETVERNLLSYCAAIAEASGGILGIGKVSAGERQLLARIASELERDHGPAARSTLASLAAGS